MAVADSIVQGVPSSPVLIFRHKGLSNSVSFTRSRFIDSCGTSAFCAPIALDMNPGINRSIGNVSFVSAHPYSRLSSASPLPFLDLPVASVIRSVILPSTLES